MFQVIPIKHAFFVGLISFIVSMASNSWSDANSELELLLEEQWQHTLKTHPVMASMQGDLRYNRQWQDLSLSAYARADIHNRKIIKKLEKIDTKALTSANRLNHALYLRQTKETVETYKLGLHLIPLSMREGVQTLFNTTSALPLNNKDQFEDWLARLEALPIVLQQTEQLMREGIKTGLTQPKIIMERVVPQLQELTHNDPEKSPFFRVFVKLPNTISEKDAKYLRKKAEKIIAGKVTPAYKKFTTFFQQEYLTASRKTPGIASVPNGKMIYQTLARHHTTTNMTPEQIHQKGLDEVARILAEMQQVMKQAKFDGDLKAFMNWMRTDSQFFYKTPQALYEGYLAVSKRLDPELVSLFGKLPRIPYGVKPIPDEIAPNTTTAYYQPLAADGSRPGYYYVNLYKPESRPKWEMQVLSVHEAVPGHHLQIALATELENVPEFRKHTSFTAYVEGWALYSERLGYQMGLYQDPYSRFGQLTYDMWRAVRLVVDTGIHYFGWSRQKAIDYFTANAPKSELDIVNEIDRYIGWPGQALAYKIGQLKILSLRAQAEKELGESFDIRDFHDRLLSTGAVPLDLMETSIREWINERKTTNKQ